MSLALVMFLVVAIVVAIVILRSVHIVPTGQVRIVERLGKYAMTAQPGLHLLVPVVDNVRAAVDMREQVVPLPPHDVVTADRRVLAVALELRTSIVDPVRATYEVADAGEALAQLARATITSVVGGLTAEEVLASPVALATQLRAVLAEGTRPWGVEVHAVTVTDVVRSPDQSARA